MVEMEPKSRDVLEGHVFPPLGVGYLRIAKDLYSKYRKKRVRSLFIKTPFNFLF